MSSRLPTVVANTDKAWFDHFRPTDELTHVDEVNFWRPSAQQRFRALQAGEPFFLRLKNPINAVAGVGYFAVQSFLSIDMAWQVFGPKNGDPSFDRFRQRILGYQQSSPNTLADPSWRLNCLVLREVLFLPSHMWLPWGEPEGWAANIVAFKTYDLADGPGQHLANLMSSVPTRPAMDLQPDYQPTIAGGREIREESALYDERTYVDRSVVERIGQGTFRARLLSAYDGRCAITSERSVPVLDAAHIQPYLGPASNHVQNGILMRTDLHRLYDAGYLTITPDLHVEVSPRLRDEYENGRVYYALHGQRIGVPAQRPLRPSKAALEWHASNVFR